jgi:hypothetical protein
MKVSTYFLLELAKHVQNIQLLLNACANNLVLRGYNHDRSKTCSVEEEAFIKWGPELNKCSYQSPRYKEIVEQAKEAARHHHTMNDHHPEHHLNGIQDMNLLNLTEMLCDWIAASKRNPGGDIFKSIELNQKKYKYSDELKSILINTAKELKVMFHLLREQSLFEEESDEKGRV